MMRPSSETLCNVAHRLLLASRIAFISAPKLLTFVPPSCVSTPLPACYPVVLRTRDSLRGQLVVLRELQGAQTGQRSLRL